MTRNKDIWEMAEPEGKKEDENRFGDEQHTSTLPQPVLTLPAAHRTEKVWRGLS